MTVRRSRRGDPSPATYQNTSLANSLSRLFSVLDIHVTYPFLVPIFSLLSLQIIRLIHLTASSSFVLTACNMAPLTDSLISLIRRAPKFDIDMHSISSLSKRTALSPMTINEIYRRDNNPKYNPGHGARPADSFNNNLFLILFALIAASMAVTGYWFFFVAKNGGFHWKKGDWDDYKSTVLRRKGPDGKTLSNATKSTKLGGGSIVPKWAADDSSTGSKSSIGDPEMGQVHHGGRGPAKHHHGSHLDPEFKAYRHEKPAAVGGLNKPVEGSHYDYTSTEPSTISSPLGKKATRKQQKDAARRAKEERKQAAKDKSSRPTRQAPVQQPPSTVQSASTHNSASYIGVPQDSPSAQRHSHYSNHRGQGPTLRTVPDERSRGSPSHSYRNSAASNSTGSPRRSQHRYADEEMTTFSNETGTKTYRHHIEGLTKGEVGIYDSISQVGASNATPPPPRRNGTGAYRRG